MKTIQEFRVLRDDVEIGRLFAEKESTAYVEADKVYGRGVKLKLRAFRPFAAEDVLLPEHAQKAIDCIGELDYCGALTASAQDNVILSAAKRRARAVIGKG